MIFTLSTNTLTSICALVVLATTVAIKSPLFLAVDFAKSRRMSLNHHIRIAIHSIVSICQLSHGCAQLPRVSQGRA
jgi:hypothetical protein